MKYDISKEILQYGDKFEVVGDRIVADIRFHISAYKGTIEREKLLDALIEENLWGDFVKNGNAELSDGTYVRLVGFQYGKENE
jgi:hypothetical protein